MIDLIGDLSNTSNQLVLAAMVAVCLMYFVVQLLRSTANWLVTEVRTESAIIEAQYLYRAVWAMVHLSMCLSLGAVTLQQVRLQSITHLAIENGVVNAMTISNQGISGEAYERLGELVAGENSSIGTNEGDVPEIEVTTPNGTSLSVSLTGRTDWAELRRADSQSGGSSGGFRRGQTLFGIRGNGGSAVSNGIGLQRTIY